MFHRHFSVFSVVQLSAVGLLLHLLETLLQTELGHFLTLQSACRGRLLELALFVNKASDFVAERHRFLL